MKKIILILLTLALVLSLCACGRESNRVSHNLSKEADNFNIMRRITVVNTRTDNILFELTGMFSIENNSHSELVILCEDANHTYHKHFIYLNSETSYVVEDISGSDVTPYHYELNILPQMWLPPVTITEND